MHFCWINFFHYFFHLCMSYIGWPLIPFGKPCWTVEPYLWNFSNFNSSTSNITWVLIGWLVTPDNPTSFIDFFDTIDTKCFHLRLSLRIQCSATELSSQPHISITGCPSSSNLTFVSVLATMCPEINSSLGNRTTSL